LPDSIRNRDEAARMAFARKIEYWHQATVTSYCILYQDADDLGGEVRRWLPLLQKKSRSSVVWRYRLKTYRPAGSKGAKSAKKSMAAASLSFSCVSAHLNFANAPIMVFCEFSILDDEGSSHPTGGMVKLRLGGTPELSSKGGLWAKSWGKSLINPLTASFGSGQLLCSSRTGGRQPAHVVQLGVRQVFFCHTTHRTLLDIGIPRLSATPLHHPLRDHKVAHT
jgi:hypothetical protein